jgi:hypothetical protein
VLLFRLLKKEYSLSHLERLWPWLIALKVVVVSVMIMLPLNLPHVWRQVDTLAVAMRYWQRWTIGSDPHPLWPAVLNSGDYFGYMGMELPLVNLMAAPFFAAGPMAGTKISMFALFGLNIILWLLALRVWRGISIGCIDVARALRWLPLIGISAINFGRFLPDTAAMLFCLSGCGLVWKNRLNPIGLGLMAVGTLIKPTACVTFAVLLLKPESLREKTLTVVQPVVAVVITLVYYLRLVPMLDRIEDNDPLFATQLRNPVETISSFFRQPLRILDMIETNIFFPGAMLALGVLLVAGRKTSGVRTMWLVLGLIIMQGLAIVALDGDHSLAHSYYYAGLSPLVVLLTAGLLNLPADNAAFKFAKGFGCLAIILAQLFAAQFDLRSLHFPPKAARMPMFAECSSLKAALPDLPWNQGYVFRTVDHDYPKLGLCFGERTASKTSGYGIFYRDEEIPTDCSDLQASKNFRVVRCREVR